MDCNFFFIKDWIQHQETEHGSREINPSVGSYRDDGHGYLRGQQQQLFDEANAEIGDTGDNNSH